MDPIQLIAFRRYKDKELIPKCEFREILLLLKDDQIKLLRNFIIPYKSGIDK